MKKISNQYLILFLLIIIIITAPLFFRGDSEFEGADDEAEVVIEELNPDYEPWFDAIWEPPSGEIESLLFSLQVAVGAGIVGYIFGVLRERRKIAVDR